MCVRHVGQPVVGPAPGDLMSAEGLHEKANTEQHPRDPAMCMCVARLYIQPCTVHWASSCCVQHCLPGGVLHSGGDKVYECGIHQLELTTTLHHAGFTQLWVNN